MFRFVCSWLVVAHFVVMPWPSNAARWVLQQNLPADEDVAQMSRQQEHELLLKHLSRKNKGDVAIDIMLELFTKITDGDFYAIISDYSKRKQQDAAVKAAFATFTKIPYQDKVFRLLNMVIREAADHFQKYKNLEAAMTLAYSSIDTQLRNLTVYEDFKREYQNTNGSSTAGSGDYKVYHYGIPKTEDELRRIFADLTNHPKMKKIALHTTFQFHLTREEIIFHQSLTQLVNATGKVDAIQQIFDESVAEMLPQVDDISAHDVDMKMPFNINLKHLKPVLIQKMAAKIKNNADLETHFETVQNRVRDLWKN